MKRLSGIIPQEILVPILDTLPYSFKGFRAEWTGIKNHELSERSHWRIHRIFCFESINTRVAEYEKLSGIHRPTGAGLLALWSRQLNETQKAWLAEKRAQNVAFLKVVQQIERVMEEFERKRIEENSAAKEKRVATRKAPEEDSDENDI